MRAKSSTSVPLTSGRSVNSRKTSLNEPKNARKEVAITGPTEVPRMLRSRFSDEDRKKKQKSCAYCVVTSTLVMAPR